MKVRRFSYKLFNLKIAIFLLFFHFSIPIYVMARDRKCNILENAKQLVFQKGEGSEDAKLMLLRLDSLINSDVVPEYIYVQAVNGVGTLFRKQGKIIYAVELYLEAVSCYEQKKELTDDEKQALIQFYIPLGASHEELGMWNRAMDFYMKALSISEDYNYETYKAMIYNNIGAIYYNREEFEKAEEYVLKALEINKKTGNKKELFNNYNNLGGIYVQRKEQDKALDYALQAIQLLDNENDAYLYYFMQTNIASLYLSKKDNILAISYLKNAMVHQQQFGFKSDLIQTYSVLAEAYERMGRRDSTQIYLEKALWQAKELNNKYVEGMIQRNLASFYKRIGNTDKAYTALLESMQVNDSISEVDNRKKMNDMEKIYDADKKVRENELLIKDITLQKVTSDRLWIFMASVTILLIITILLLVTRARNKEKERKTQTLLVQQQTALYEKEKELQQQKEQELNYTIDQRNRELTSYTLYMVKTNEFISDINEELKHLLLELNPKDRSHKQHLQQILSKLQQQNTTNNWNEFRYYFEQVHPSFYENLEKRYPDLTIKEKRLCAFLRLGLSSKDISAITFKEVRSVESARNRLRKKLGMTPDGNLTEFLSQNLS